MTNTNDKLKNTEDSRKQQGKKREAESEGGEYIAKQPKKETAKSAGEEVDFDKMKGNKK